MDPLSLFLSEEKNLVQVDKKEKSTSSSSLLESFSSSDDFSSLMNTDSQLLKELYLLDYAYSRESPRRINNEVDNTRRNESINNSHQDSPSKANLKGTGKNNYFSLLSGESLLFTLDHCYGEYVQGQIKIAGTLTLTNYRLVFEPPKSYMDYLISVYPSLQSYFNVPLNVIDRIEREKRSADGNYFYSLCFHCKDIRSVRINVHLHSNQNDSGIEIALRKILINAFPNNVTRCFAFNHSLPSSLNDVLQPCSCIDLIAEYGRQGIIDTGETNLCRITKLNYSYQFCSSYPKVFLVPRLVTDEELNSVGSFRTGKRVPACCWGDKRTKITLWRSSQPKCGVSGSNSYDERYLDIIARSCIYKGQRNTSEKSTLQPLLQIIDCRPKTSAMANRAAGAGYEMQTNYPNTRLEFYNIGNIHVMKESFRSLTSIIVNHHQNSAIDINFSKYIEDTQWLYHIRLILKAAWDSANYVINGVPVLVHCSHGWDRTAQVCSLALLFLDPYYRTFAGFKILIEKEWNAFGHQFYSRCAITQDKDNRVSDDFSPIFIQFLDAVWQLIHQFPQVFEFNSRYVLTIADHLYSGRFDNFLFDSDYDRDSHNTKNCVSLWTYLEYNKPALLNPFYLNIDSGHSSAVSSWLPPLSQLLRNISLWEDYFLRWGSVPILSYIPKDLYYNLRKDGITIPQWNSRLDGSLSELEYPDLDLPFSVTRDDMLLAKLNELMRLKV